MRDAKKKKLKPMYKTKQPIKIALEYDDFSPKNTHFELLEELREHYPGFKVTMFIVPWEVRFGEQTPITQPEYAAFVKACKQSTDWLEIAVHGLTHAPMEFAELSEEGARKRLVIGEKMFENREMKIAKIFKAPFWALSKEGKIAAEKLGYKVVEDHYYNWNLVDDFPQEVADRGDVIIAHGHVQNVVGNGMEETFSKLMKLPPDTTFYKLSEVLK